MKGFETALTMSGGLFRLIAPEAAVDAGHNKIEAGENVVGVVEGAIGADVGFNALEDAERPPEFLIERIDLLMLLKYFIDGEATRIVCRLRVIGDAEIAVASFTGGFGHFPKCVDAIGKVGVNVKQALEVLLLNE